MRAVWGYATRPRLSSARGSRDAASTIFRRNPAPYVLHHRPLTFNDAFAIFLAPFLAAATIVNLSWKQKQKKDWEKKLANIDREIELLRAREVDTWNRIQLSSSRKGARRGRRSYSTVAAGAAEDNLSDFPGDPTLDKDSLAPFMQMPFQVPTETTYDEPEKVIPIPGNAGPPSDAVVKLERLIAFRLSLQLLLHVHTASPLEFGTYDSYTEDKPPPEIIGKLIEQLQNATTEMMRLERTTSRFEYLFHSSPEGSNQLLSTRIKEVGGEYQAGRRTQQQLLEGLSRALLTSTRAPSIIAYTRLVRLLSSSGLTNVVPLVLSAIQSSKLILDEVAFDRMLRVIAQNRAVAAFDWCLTEITRAQSRLQLSQRWEWRRILGEAVPVPSSGDPRLLVTLTLAALSLEQRLRAEAWASILIQSNYQGAETLELIKTFLYYYTKHFHWDKGRIWIKQAIKYARFVEEKSFASFKHFQLIVFRMLALCASCNRSQEYSEILRAAVDADLHPPTIEGPGMNNEQTKAILLEWRRLMEAEEPKPEITDTQRIQQFQETLRSSEMYKAVNSVPNMELEGDVVPGHDSESLEALHAKQREMIEEARMEFEDTQTKLRSQLEESRLLQAKLQSLLDQHASQAHPIDVPKEPDRLIDANKCFEEQQITIELLRKELAQHRELIELESQSRRQDDQKAKAQELQIQRLHVEFAKVLERSNAVTDQGEGRDRVDIKHSAQDTQLEQMRAQIIHLQNTVQSLSAKESIQSPQQIEQETTLSAMFGTSAEQQNTDVDRPDDAKAEVDTLTHPSSEAVPVRHMSMDSDNESDSGYSSASSVATGGVGDGFWDKESDVHNTSKRPPIRLVLSQSRRVGIE